MPPTGLQRDPYGVDTEGATIPRLKPWVTPTQPPRGYPRCLQDCLPLFAEHIGGVAQRDEGVDTVSLTTLPAGKMSPLVCGAHRGEWHNVTRGLMLYLRPHATGKIVSPCLRSI